MGDPTYDPDLEGAIVGEVDRSIPFIDTHHHLWELGRFRYDWLTDELRADGTYGPVVDNSVVLGDYRMIRHDWPMDRLLKEFYGSNVVGSVHVEAAYAGPDPVEETAWLASVAGTHGYPTAIVAYLDVEADGAAALLDRHLAASDRVRGIRPRAHPAGWDTPAFAAAMVALAERDLTYELTVPDLWAEGAAAAAAFPGTRMIVGHAGNPTRRDRAYFDTWRAGIDAVAAQPNVSCKISGFGMVDHHWTVDSITPWTLHCVEAFGPDRIMFGTNWPVDVLFSSYLRQVDAYRWIIARAGFSRAEQEAMLFRNAVRIHRLGDIE